MVNITLSVSEELKKRLQKYDEVNWSAVTRRALEEHLNKMEIAEKIASKGKLTRKDADEISKLIKRDIAKAHGLIRD